MVDSIVVKETSISGGRRVEESFFDCFLQHSLQEENFESHDKSRQFW
jgi:hypothetical protein